MRSYFMLCAVVAIGCGSSTPPPVVATEQPKEQEPEQQTASKKAPAIEYDLGPVDPTVAKKKIEALKGDWNDCYLHAHEKHETLEGKLTFTIRTAKDGSVKWAFVKDSDVGHRGVEKCVIDSIKATNWGAPMDAKEGEIQAHTVGWQLDPDARPADPGAQASVAPIMAKAKAKLEACRKPDMKGKMIATFYVAKGGKPISVGIAVEDPSADGAIDCVHEVLMGLKYVNKASWPVKVTTPVP